MALFHKATITPTKAELVASWAPTQPWCPDNTQAGDVEVFGAFRFDDPAGEVGIETHMIRLDGAVFQVPVTYRAAPLDHEGARLVGTMEHSALGTRWVYDGVTDPVYVMMLTAVAITGQGEALGLVEVDGRWIIAPANVRITGGGGTLDRVPVDRFDADGHDEFANDRFRLYFHRAPLTSARPPMGLSATWEGLPEPVLLASVAHTDAP